MSRRAAEKRCGNNDKILRRSAPLSQAGGVSAHPSAADECAALKDALSASRAAFRNIVENNVFGIMVTDKAGIVLFVNQAAERIFRRERSILVGSMFGTVARGSDVSEVEIMRSDSDKGTGELRVIETEWEGKPANLVSIHDVTDYKRSQEALRDANSHLAATMNELKETQAQVIRQERLRVLGTMTSGVAHDFNNVLVPIMGYSELLLSRSEYLEDKKKGRHLLTMIYSAAKDASRVVARLTESYRHRREEDPFRPVDLNRVVKDAALMTKPKWRNESLRDGCEIELQIVPEGPAMVIGNDAELREVLTNMILNSVDALPHGGKITLKTRTNGKFAVIEVSDTGVGMSGEVADRCTDPFFTTKSARGTGLGLSVSHGIVRRHGGEIEVKSAENEGTTFIVRLPLMQAEAERHSRTGKGSAVRPLRVLVVDDDAMVREVVTAYLAGDGHSVETAENGSRGLEKFLAGRFDVVVTDVAMPEMNGAELAKAVKEIAPRKPVIVLTGFGEMAETVQGAEIPVDRIISKPVTLANFRQALQDVVIAGTTRSQRT